MNGIQKFVMDLGVSMENCESMIAFHILEFSSFFKVQFFEFEKALVKHNAQTVQQLSKTIKPQIVQYANDIAKFKEFHKKAFQMAKQDDSYNNLEAEIGLGILECTYNVNLFYFIQQPLHSIRK